MKTKERIDLTSGNVWKIMLLYTLPLFGSAMVQQAYSMVDLLIVGNFAQNSNLAVNAVGNAATVVNILLAFSFGANGGCSVIIARYFGVKNYKKVKETLNTSVITFSITCAAVMLVGFGMANFALVALDVHESYFADCLSYLYIYTGSLPFVFLYNVGCGVCSAMGDSKTPFLFLILSSVLNIALDALFVCVLHWDVAGAAWATFISQAISAVLTTIVLAKKFKAITCEEKPARFNPTICKDLICVSLPIVLQNSFVSVGSFFVGKKINGISLDATTGFTAAFRLVCMANVGVGQMTNGLANFCSQNKAAEKYQRIKQGYVALMVYALITNIIFMVPFICAPEFCTRLFVEQEKLTVEALECSKQFLVIVSSFLPVVCVKIVSDGVVRGCGGNLGFMISTFVDLILRVVLVYVLVDPMGFSGVCWAWAIGWSVSMFIAVGFYLAIPCLRGVKYFNRKNSFQNA
ncbi:MAG: MATE family efflux transporter [Candidatus Coproplasma sp.]